MLLLKFCKVFVFTDCSSLEGIEEIMKQPDHFIMIPDNSNEIFLNFL